jgi:hypothetical protein
LATASRIVLLSNPHSEIVKVAAAASVLAVVVAASKQVGAALNGGGPKQVAAVAVNTCWVLVGCGCVRAQNALMRLRPTRHARSTLLAAILDAEQQYGDEHLVQHGEPA